MQTELLINRVGFPPCSARGCKQVLTPVIAGDFRRTVNGELVYTGRKGHNKYTSVIFCQDMAPPTLEGVWRGEEVNVSCIQRLWQEIQTDSQSGNILVNLERPYFSQSVIAHTECQKSLDIIEKDETRVEINLGQGAVRTIYLSYRPVLRMRVKDFSMMTSEWQHTCGWRLVLEEI